MSEFDVIVVGGGGAGLAAASEAASLGRKTVLLEKENALGGSTAWSVGSISATNTPHQRAKGIIDRPDAHFEDLDVLAGGKRNRDNLALRRILVDNATDALRWLESAGLVFAGPNPEPPHRLPRMHNVLPNSRAFPHALGRHCRKLGVDIRLNAEADQLLTEANREVNLSASRLSHKGDVRLDLSMGRDKLVSALKETASKRKSLISHINIQELWEVLYTEQEWIDLSTMTQFCFPNNPTFDHEAAVIRAFFDDKQYFKFNPDKFFPNRFQVRRLFFLLPSKHLYVPLYRFPLPYRLRW